MEVLDIVDEQGNPTGKVIERETAHRQGIRHRTSHVWLLCKKRGRIQILLQKRSEEKDSYPGCYDISSAGHIPAGVDFIPSALRELKEELGYEANPGDLIYCGTRSFRFEDQFHGIPFRDNQVSNIYLLWTNQAADEFVLQTEEVSGVRWFDFKECMDAVANNSICHCIFMEELKMIEERLKKDTDGAFSGIPLFYMAPMEGLTGYLYRNAYQKHFHNIDKYFTPFLVSKNLGYRERNDILPEHNEGMQVVPQILTNKAEDFICIAKELKQYGYESVNLNLGCPSGTVAAKHRGAGFLAVPKELERFLSGIFEQCPIRISVKTRIGIESTEEWEDILAIYEKFPLEELVIHPRLQQDFYKYKPHMEAFQLATERSSHSLCYNGDICTVSDYRKLMQDFSVGKVMLGRGIMINPGLVGQIRGNDALEKKKLREFHDDILEGYQEILSGDKNVLYRMKELWHYMGTGFMEPEKYLKKIRKSQRVAEYEAAVSRLFEERELIKI